MGIAKALYGGSIWYSIREHSYEWWVCMISTEFSLWFILVLFMHHCETWAWLSDLMTSRRIKGNPSTARTFTIKQQQPSSSTHGDDWAFKQEVVFWKSFVREAGHKSRHLLGGWQSVTVWWYLSNDRLSGLAWVSTSLLLDCMVLQLATRYALN